MERKLIFLVDEDNESTKSIVDIETGEERQTKTSPKEVCDGIAYTPMTEAVRDITLYHKKSTNGQRREPVRLGDLGPYILVQSIDGQIVNGFGVRDIAKPLSISAETVRDLASIFGGKERKKS